MEETTYRAVAEEVQSSESGLRPVERLVVLALAEFAHEHLTIADLVRLTSASESTVRRTLTTLVQAGWAERVDREHYGLAAAHRPA